MLSPEVLLAFVLSVVVICLSPGPSNLYIMASTLAKGGRAGLQAAGGMAIGSFIYVIGTAFSLAALMKLAPGLFMAIKIAGAGYLVFLGVQTYRSAKAPELVNTSTGKRNTFRQSIIVELTNPKTALFFLAFLPQFTDPARGDTTSQFLLLGAIYSMIAFCCDSLVVALSKTLKTWLTMKPEMAIYQERFAGVVLILLGLFLFTDLALSQL